MTPADATQGNPIGPGRWIYAEAGQVAFVRKPAAAAVRRSAAVRQWGIRADHGRPDGDCGDFAGEAGSLARAVQRAAVGTESEDDQM